jgi:hypothetical protein
MNCANFPWVVVTQINSQVSNVMRKQKFWVDNVSQYPVVGSNLHLGLEQYNIHDAPFVKGVSDQLKQRGRRDVINRLGKGL